MGLPSPEAALQDHDALLGRAALSVEVGDLVALASPAETVALEGAFGTTLEIRKQKCTASMLLQSIQPLSEPYGPSTGTRKPRSAGAEISPHMSGSP